MNFPTVAAKLATDHAREWIEGSGVDPAITYLNVETLEDTAVSGTDVSYPIHDRLGWHLTRFGRQTRGKVRGWWVSGLDPLNHWQPMTWGRFKPDSDTPILDREKGEAAKYLSPKREVSPSKCTFLRIPRYIGVKIAVQNNKLESYATRILRHFQESQITARHDDWECQRGAVEVDDAAVQGAIAHLQSQGFTGDAAALSAFLSEEDPGFWAWVWDAKIPPTLTEGEKKAGALLTAGYAAIALPGISSGARTKDAQGNPLHKPHLIPELARFATNERQIDLVFDYETKDRVQKAIYREIEKLSGLFRGAGAILKVISLPGPQKGVDDFILARGVDAYHAVYNRRKTLTHWQAVRQSVLSAVPNVRLNQRYLGTVQIPSDRHLVMLKSPKGTGKTEWFKGIVEEAMGHGQRVILITHRVQLAQAICNRVGLPYVTELRSSEEGAMLGYGLCIDSLHPESQARFDAQYWRNPVVILDECEQVLLHLLEANTEVAKHRTTILSQFRELLLNAIESPDGKIILADADLSDLSLRFIQGLVEDKVEPYTIVNEWVPQDEACVVWNYNQPTANHWFAALHQEVESGGRPLIVVQAQKEKSTFSSTTIERYLNTMFPEKKGLRIDSVTVSDPSHPAYNCTEDINKAIAGYDYVITSPTLETGVSIDTRGQFTSVWGYLNGVVGADSARQSLARLREPVDRHVWIRKVGLSEIGNGATTMRGLLQGEQQVAKLAGQLLKTVAFQDDLLRPWGACLDVWAAMVARINAGLKCYREAVLEGLRGEGHHVFDLEEPTIETNIEEIMEALKTIRDLGKTEAYEAIAAEELISQSEYEKLKSKKNKTKEEHYRQTKYEISQRYLTDEVDPELVEKDQDGWHGKLRLYYYLTIGQTFLRERDEDRLENVLKTSGHWLPTLNDAQLSTRIRVLKQLKIDQLLNPKEEFNGGQKKNEYSDAHDLLIEIYNLATQGRNAQAIKNILGVGVSAQMSPIRVAQTLLGKIGIKLECSHQVGGKGNRQRVYVYKQPKDGRDEVLARWFNQDTLKRSESEMHDAPIKEVKAA